MRTFDSLEDIRQASEEELLEIPEMNAQAARAVVQFFKEKE